ncbi:MAG TPA: type II secretion system protein [Candidatus Paceibacterota bacterium]|nr:type II secretion system protein [Candidatus Paceibacterota bacterium]
MRGFTLIEMLVSVAIFSIVMVMALGALLALSDANRQAQLLSIATNNFNSSLDSMSRAIRTGTAFHCGGGTLTVPADCALSPSTQFSFLSADGLQTVYKLGTTECSNGVGCILRSQDGGSSYVSITSTDIVVTKLAFYVKGSLTSDGVQPRAVILASGYTTVKAGQKTQFNVQTSITQRIYDQ